MSSRTSIPPRLLRDHVLERGRSTVDADEIAELTGLTRAAAVATMSRLRRAGHFFSPAPGLYVVIPPQFASWRVVPAADFIDPMMSRLGRAYYVGLLSAAELHGASHQRPQAFQVMVDRALGNRDIERVHLRFYSRSRLTQVPVVRRNSSTGQIRVATPEATVLDLASRPNDAGGLDNVATIVAELADQGALDGSALEQAADIYPLAVVRRLGWLLDIVSDETDTADLADPLAARIARRTSNGTRAVDLLDPSGPRRGTADTRWGIVQNTDVEPEL